MPTLLFDVDAAALTDAATGGAGTTTGVPPLTDVQGGVWSNDATNIVGTESAGGNGWQRDLLVNLADAACADQRVIMTIVAGTDHAIAQGMAWIALRYRVDAGTKKHFEARLDNDGVQWYWIEGGTATALTKTFFATALVSGTTYEFEASIIGTTYAWDMRVSGGASNFSGAQSATDATADRQIAGHMGSNTGVGASPMKFRRLRGWNEGAAAFALSVSPASVTVNTTTSITATGTNTTWTAATTFSADVGTISNLVVSSATAVTFDYAAPASAQTATITAVDAEDSPDPTATITVAAAAGLTSGTLSKGTQTGTSIGVTGTAATGGTTPYTYAWYRGEYPGFTMDAGTLLAGQTGQNLTDTAITFGPVYFYRRRVTDSAGTPATADTAELLVGTIRSALQIGIVGDSQMTAYLGAGTGPVPFAETVLEEAWGQRAVTFVNQAVSGSQSSQWISGSTNLTNARTAFTNATTTPYVVVMLGANDSNAAVTAATYLTNMTSAINDLTGAGYVVILCYTPYITHNDWTTADRALLHSYRAQLDTLINGTTVLRGERDAAWPYAANNSGTLYGDGVHFSAGGAAIYGRMLARAIMEAIGGHGPGGTTGTILIPDAVPNLAEDSGAQTVTLTRTAQADITEGCVGVWNGAERVSRRVSATALEVDLLAADVVNSGGATLMIFKPS